MRFWYVVLDVKKDWVLKLTALQSGEIDEMHSYSKHETQESVAPRVLIFSYTDLYLRTLVAVPMSAQFIGGKNLL